MNRLVSTLAFAAFVALSPVALSSAVMAADAPATGVETYQLEKPHTQIAFSVNHLGFSNSIGKFTDFDGTIHFDRQNPEKSDVSVTIKTASIDMNDQKWNDHLKNPDFFNVEKFPDMIFKSTGITPIADNAADIAGDLTILGVTKPVVLRAVFNNAGPHPMNPAEYRSGFSATTTIKRSEFGMNYGLPMVGDDVAIRIEVEAIRDPLPAQVNP